MQSWKAGKSPVYPMIPYAIFCQAQANNKTCKAEPHGEREQARHGKQCNVISAISFLQALKILKPAPAGEQAVCSNMRLHR